MELSSSRLKKVLYLAKQNFLALRIKRFKREPPELKKINPEKISYISENRTFRPQP